MPKFINKGRVPIYEHEHLTPDHPEQHTVWIKERMNSLDTAICKDKLMRTNRDFDEFHSGLQQAQLELLVINIVDWAGPDFGNVKPSRKVIEEDIDPTEPLWQRILDEIDRLNTPVERLPKLTQTPSTDDGATSSAESDGSPAEILTPKFSSQNATTGRRIKSVN